MPVPYCPFPTSSSIHPFYSPVEIDIDISWLTGDNSEEGRKSMSFAIISKMDLDILITQTVAFFIPYKRTTTNILFYSFAIVDYSVGTFVQFIEFVMDR